MALDQIVEFVRSLWGLWLMIFFLGIIAWAFLPRNKDRLESYRDMPLREDKEDNEER